MIWHLVNNRTESTFCGRARGKLNTTNDARLVTCKICTKAANIKAADPSPKQAFALRLYALKYGKTWKRDLRLAWQFGRDDKEALGGYLRQVRNTFGPGWLEYYRMPKLPMYAEVEHMSVGEICELLALKDYDTALPQLWVDECSKFNFDPRGKFVVWYGEGSPLGGTLRPLYQEAATTIPARLIF